MNGAADAPAHPRRRVKWSLQTRLIATVVGMVALILAMIGVATSAILGNILSAQLDNQVQVAVQRVASQIVGWQTNLTGPADAYDVLTKSRLNTSDILLVVKSRITGIDGAYQSGNDKVVSLSDAQVNQIIASFTKDNAQYTTVTIDTVGTYRLFIAGVGNDIIMVGLPLSTVSSTIAQILTTVALVTTGGLLLLAAVIALVIRYSLRPLRAVAATATRVAGQPLDSGDVTISERVPASEADATDEIGRVGAALNTLLDHVDASLAARQRNEERMRSFVADASHELRTPLAAIRGYSELSLRSLRTVQAAGDEATPAQVAISAEQSEQSLERIQSASLRMTALVEDLLLLARLDEGKELVYGAVDLTRVVVDSVADAQAAGPAHQWELDAAEEPVVVAGDAMRLHQVVANLLTNARVHTPAGTTVTAGVAVEGSDAVVRIADDGPGIDPAIVDALFERFSRGDTSRARQTGGTGLGLSIARAIMTAHHGTISVDSAPGRTVFEVRLPARPAVPRTADAPV
ncbi:two-component system OmpR family sensor kinase [Microbacterium sp. AG790]|uniref:sensor histidine kinase n=1 Tax=Microbacterium sp. AG790 TaxID=2183995 RepID=UPI000EB21F13|nr:ATP-binding protein [Microbacterium sp. AG790]RKS93643.1 two-component system OmpR family sensor kinase [Microbacterium sp. AG790]